MYTPYHGPTEGFTPQHPQNFDFRPVQPRFRFPQQDNGDNNNNAGRSFDLSDLIDPRPNIPDLTLRPDLNPIAPIGPFIPPQDPQPAPPQDPQPAPPQGRGRGRNIAVPYPIYIPEPQAPQPEPRVVVVKEKSSGSGTMMLMAGVVLIVLFIIFMMTRR